MPSGSKGRCQITVKIAWFLMLALACTGQSDAAVTIQSVAYNGGTLPGMEPGVVVDNIGTPSINASGQLAFLAILEGTGIDSTNNLGLWTGKPGNLHKYIQEGDAAPGTEDGTVFGNITYPGINASGQVVFRALLSGPNVDSSNNYGIWSDNTGSLHLVARTGDQVPGLSEGMVYYAASHSSATFSDPTFNDSGQIVFGFHAQDSVTQGPLKGGYFLATPSDSKPFVMVGDKAPGTPPGVYLGSLFEDAADGYTQYLNDAGEIAFVPWIYGTDIDTSNNRGVWTGTEDNIELIVRQSDQVPGMDPGVEFNSLAWRSSINNAGQLAFLASFNDPSTSTQYQGGVWLYDGSTLTSAAQAGDPVPGMDATTFSSFQYPLVSNDGKAVFYSLLSGYNPVTGNNSTGALCISDGSDVQLLVKSGDHAPGLADDILFSSVHYKEFALNSANQVVFQANLMHNDSVDDSNDMGLWATDLNGDLHLIVRTGDQVDVNDDPLIEDLRTVQYFRFHSETNNEDGRRSSFSDSGQISYLLEFTDGTYGLFVATIGLPGDLNSDGFVGLDDLDLVLSNWNLNVSPGDALSGDASGDGFVGLDDLDIVLGNWNTGTPPVLADVIPEPGVGLVMLGVMPWVMRRK